MANRANGKRMRARNRSLSFAPAEGRAPDHPRYGLMSYGTSRNLGDEIQSIAAAAFLPRVDEYIERESLNARYRQGVLYMILNGWFMHRPENWPPAGNIAPHFNSFHLTPEKKPMNRRGLSALTLLNPGPGLDYLQRHAPIGARDLFTLDLLQRRHVPSFFSGCLTLTLPASAEPRHDAVCANDLAPDMVRAIRSFTSSRVVVTTHRLPRWGMSRRYRMWRAKQLLQQYAQARLVITSRLHCALPCLALGTPVIFMPPDANDVRFSGLLKFLVTSSGEAMLDREFDLDDPPRNNHGHVLCRNRLIEECRTFVRRAGV